jgi:hypothetical protein
MARARCPGGALVAGVVNGGSGGSSVTCVVDSGSSSLDESACTIPTRTAENSLPLARKDRVRGDSPLAGTACPGLHARAGVRASLPLPFRERAGVRGKTPSPLAGEGWGEEESCTNTPPLTTNPTVIPEPRSGIRNSGARSANSPATASRRSRDNPHRTPVKAYLSHGHDTARPHSPSPPRIPMPRAAMHASPGPAKRRLSRWERVGEGPAREPAWDLPAGLFYD